MRTESVIRALADPTRLRIMRLLAHMELAVGEIAQVLGQSQPRWIGERADDRFGSHSMPPTSQMQI